MTVMKPLLRLEGCTSRRVAFSLGLSPKVGLVRGRLQQNALFVTAFVDRQAVLIGSAVFERYIFSTNPAELGIFLDPQHGEYLTDTDWT